MTELLWGVGIALLLLSFASLYRAEVGPSIQDRILAVNLTGTNVLVLLVVLAAIAGHRFLIDVAIILALLNLIITLAATRFIEQGRFAEAEDLSDLRGSKGAG
jgi:multicomponent Na+:H+ antiporter subunit F